MVLDNVKHSYNIDGCTVTLSFSEEPNYDLFNRIKSILLSPDSVAQNCNNPDKNDNMQKSDKEAQ